MSRQKSRFQRWSPAIVAVLLLSIAPSRGLATECEPAPSAWQQDEFFLGAWHGCWIYSDSLTNLQHMQLLRDAGFNVIVNFPGTPRQVEGQLRQALWNAKAVGLKIMIESASFSETCDWDTTETVVACANEGGPCAQSGTACINHVCQECLSYWGTASNNSTVRGQPWEQYCFSNSPCLGPEDPLEICGPCLECVPHYYRYSISSLLRSTVLGYYVGDEPFPAEEEEVKSRVAAVNTQDPSKLAYFNLNPFNIPPVDFTHFASRAAYESYLNSMTTDPDPSRSASVVSFDRYPFLAPGCFLPPCVDTSYFYNIDAIRRSAGTRPFWATIQTASLPGTQEPTESRILFEASCPIAYGARGLGYFNYDQTLANNELETTALYAPVQKLNRYLSKIVGPVVMASAHLGAFHQANTPWGETIPVAQRVSPNTTPIVASLGNTQLLLGVFRSNSSPTVHHLWVANKALTSQTAQLSLKGNYTSKVWLAPAEPTFVSDTTYIEATTAYNSASNRTTVSFSLTGGEGRMLRVTGVTSVRYAFLRTDYDGDGISDLSARTTNGTWVIDQSHDGFAPVGPTGWQSTYTGYPALGSTATMADYDGDGMTDLSAKSDTANGTLTGMWRIDYASDGYGAWNQSYCCYGPALARPAPFDYDGDRKADPSVMGTEDWFINYASDNNPPQVFGPWNDILHFPVGLAAGSIATPGDYDGDGKGDIAAWEPSARKLRIDYAANGRGAWDDSVTYTSTLGTHEPLPGDYDGDGKWDLALRVVDRWHIVYGKTLPGGTWTKNIRQQTALFEDFEPVPGDYDGDGLWDLALVISNQSPEWKIDLAANGFGQLQGWDRTYSGYDFEFQHALHRVLGPIQLPATRVELAVEGGQIQSGPVRVRLSGLEGQRVSVDVFDVRGRQVARIFEGVLKGAATSLDWPGTDYRGSRVPPGAYWLRAQTKDSQSVERLLLMR